MDAKVRIQKDPRGVVLFVKVVPNSSRDAIVGLLGDQLKIKVSKPPEGGKANRAVEALLADLLGVAGSRVSVIAGHSQAQKQILVAGVGEEQVRRAISSGH